jgi:N utilization substance protein A
MKEEILRLVDTIHRSKEIDKEIVFQGIEAALLSAVRKKYGESETIRVVIDRETGETRVFDGDTEIDTEDLGRLAAMTGKQVLFQKIREAERDRIFEEYEHKVGTLVSGVVQRHEGPNLIVNLGRVEGFLPRSEQAPGERFKVGERIKVLVKEVKKNTNRVKITLSRTDPALVRALFELEVPEIAEKVNEIKEIAREPGYRTKIAVTTYDHNVDCVGACVGVRGSRIKNIVDELFGEKIDIVRWNESIEVLIMNALKPAEISSMDLDFDQQRATIYVKPEQQSLAIGRRGQNVRLASKLSCWDLDIQTITDEELEKMRREPMPGMAPQSGAESTAALGAETAAKGSEETPLVAETTEAVGVAEPAQRDGTADFPEPTDGIQPEEGTQSVDLTEPVDAGGEEAAEETDLEHREGQPEAAETEPSPADSEPSQSEMA